MTISAALLNLCMGTWACRFRTFRRDRNHCMYITNCFVWKRYLELKENVKNDRPRSHDCEALGPKLQNFHDPIVSHFPEEA